MSSFKKVLMGGEWEPQFWDANLSLEAACDRYAEQAKSFGLTALQVNFIPDPYHPLLFAYPGEVYLYFGNYAASLDMFADSSYSRGIYPPFMMQANLHRLRTLAKAAERHGLGAFLYVGEPRFVHPELLRRYPNWRGPRVDNPAVSMTPLYALDTDRDDVLDHYRQMMRTVTQAAPNLTDLVLFCHDSGAGFSHSYALYAGPNGPFYNSTFFHRPAKLGQRVVRFCKALRDTALETWWNRALHLRSGGYDRLLLPAPYSPTRNAIRPKYRTWKVYVQEIVWMQIGRAHV